MSPIDHFHSAWTRCDQLSAIHSFLSGNVTSALSVDELLRAEWVARVSALDLYVHELVTQNMLAIFEGHRPSTPAYSKFQLSNDTIARIRSAANVADASSAFELEVRDRLSLLSYQDPEKIADGIRLVSTKELWNEVALLRGVLPAKKTNEAKALKRGLSLIVERRNKIAHEGDVEPGTMLRPWPIDSAALAHVRTFIHDIVTAINHII